MAAIASTAPSTALSRDVFEERTQNAQKRPLTQATQNAAEDCLASTPLRTGRFEKGEQPRFGQFIPPEVVYKESRLVARAREWKAVSTSVRRFRGIVLPTAPGESVNLAHGVRGLAACNSDERLRTAV